ncbi:Chaperone protein Skp [termite gut metagenome]|uniref:Chaperone protein Skp n=1 Tax=termite gut metagenome TaxID=433724 RepID=A0A5J4SUD5_9ZZZZ
MKRSVFITLLLLFAINLTANAQKFALIDMEYILQHIPSYEKANKELDQISQKYQSEVEALTEQAQVLYKEYQSKAASLSEGQRTKKEEEIVAKEKAVAELRHNYFGPEGELLKKRENIMKPIQDDIYKAIKEISEMEDYSIVIDRASEAGIIFASPRIDISNEVLVQLGYADSF